MISANQSDDGLVLCHEMEEEDSPEATTYSFVVVLLLLVFICIACVGLQRNKPSNNQQLEGHFEI
jgi:hypothetical protein